MAIIQQTGTVPGSDDKTLSSQRESINETTVSLLHLLSIQYANVFKKGHNPNWTGEDVNTSNVDEEATLRKMDWHLIPMLAVLYLLSFLDRSNIGNAKIQGMQTDLNLSGTEYSLCATVFFFTYCAFEIPSNLLLKRFRPSIWLPSIMIAWGTVMTLMGLVQDYHGLLIARIFLGVAEAGLYPGVG